MVHVFLYVPNLIGYVRVIGALVSLSYALSEPWTFVWIYTFSMGLDAIDGVAARALNQSALVRCVHVVPRSQAVSQRVTVLVGRRSVTVWCGA